MAIISSSASNYFTRVLCSGSMWVLLLLVTQTVHVCSAVAFVPCQVVRLKGCVTLLCPDLDCRNAAFWERATGPERCRWLGSGNESQLLNLGLVAGKESRGGGQPDNFWGLWEAADAPHSLKRTCKIQRACYITSHWNVNKSFIILLFGSWTLTVFITVAF